MIFFTTTNADSINPLNAELSPICHLLVLLEAHQIFHVSGLRFNIMLVSTIFRLKKKRQRDSTTAETLPCSSFAPILLWLRNFTS